MTKSDFLPKINIRNLVIKLIIVNIIMYMCAFVMPANRSVAVQTKYAYTQGCLSNYPGYDALLQNLQAKHPNWHFTILDTGLDWNDVIKNETVAVHGRNLVYITYSGSWVCPTCGNRPYDSGMWKCASEMAVSYYMDPRNWINENNIFQFENLAYNGDIQNIDGVNKILSTVPWARGSTITYTKPDGSTGVLYKSYAQVIMDAARDAGISPYHLAARIRLEQGSNSVASPTGNGNYGAYRGYYNFCNIQATGSDILGNALRHAQANGWDNPEKAIRGGAQFLASSYISKGQSTLYLQKFDVDSSDGGLYYHQYMQNISGAYTEGNTVKSSYESMGLLDSSINFVIPVYNNMPQERTDGTEGLSPVTQNVQVTGDNVAVRNGRSVQAQEVARVNSGDVLLRIETTSKQNDGYYWDKVVLPNGTKGYIARNFINQINDVQNANISAVANVAVNLRNGPGTNNTSVIRTLTVGQSVTIIETDKYNGLDGYNWARVKLNDGSQGYLVRSYLTETAQTNYQMAFVNCNDDGKVYVRSGASTNTTIVTALRKDTKVTVLQKNAGSAGGYSWDKIVTLDGLEGYMANTYLRYEDNNSGNNNNGGNNSGNDNGGNNNSGDNNGGNNTSGDNNTIATPAGTNDVDGNGVVNSADLFCIVKFLKENNNAYNEAYDVNKDNAVNSGDLYQIVLYLKQN